LDAWILLVPCISAHVTAIAEPEAGLSPIFPVIAPLTGPASVIAVVAKITKLFVVIDPRLTAVGPGGAVTDNWAAADWPLKEAVMTTGVMVGLTPVARPTTSTVALPLRSAVQAAVVVTSEIDKSLYVPVAVNCLVLPAATEAVPGVTVIDVNVAAVTVNVAVAVLPSKTAVMTTGAVLAVRPVARPVCRPTVALADPEVQLADVAMSEVDESR
jgi:hypothetical protein